jgi:molecular chaperone DnaK
VNSSGKTKLLGNFQHVGIPPEHRAVPQIDGTFDIDADFIVDVSARDKATSKNRTATISSGSGLSDSEMKSMLDDVEKYGEADKALRALIVGCEPCRICRRLHQEGLERFCGQARQG